VELFSPQTVPRARDSRRHEPIVDWTPGDALPWEPGHPLTRRSPGRHTEWRHFVYLGVFDLGLLSEELEARLGASPEIGDEMPAGEGCLAAFAVTRFGRPLVDSFTLSSLAWALGRLQSPGPDDGDWLDGFEPAQTRAVDAFAGRMSLDEDDEEGQRIVDLGFRVGPSLSPSALSAEVEAVRRTLRWPQEADQLGVQVRIRSAPVARRRKYSTDDFDFLNSFFLDDLRRVRTAFEEGDVGEALTAYLALPNDEQRSERVDLRRRVEVVAERLEPQWTPAGRWAQSWPLVCSQQFAVNSAFESLLDGGGLFAVNGPPGTGKTTLLRDLVAAVVVERADALASLASPAQAFGDSAGWWQSGQYRRSPLKLDSRLCGHQVVVASTNNGAVENVSLEIPRLDAVAAELVGDLDYFADVGSSVIGEPAWGLLAAPLGNKRNRSRFVSRWWFGNHDDEGDDSDLPPPGFLDLLKSPPEVPSWKQAVASYEEVRDEVEQMRQVRQEAADLLRAAAELEHRLETFGDEIEELGRRRAASEAVAIQVRTAAAAAAETAEARRVELAAVGEARPGLLAILLSLGRAYREWNAEARPYRERWVAANAAHEQARRSAEEREQELRDLAQASEEAELRRDETRQRLEAMQRDLEAATRSFGGQLPTADLWRNEERREKSAPWSDEAWSRARAHLFVEALRLHRAFVLGAAQSFRRNLMAAADVLSGSVPAGTERQAVEAAWETFFLLVPVVSTTFASFDRLFSHLGRERLGWLLIDEAGQAVPQAAVGGIWRSRRVIVVGDPQQLEPVVTLPDRALGRLREHFGVGREWQPNAVSVQHLADRRTPVGTELPGEGDSLWVGSPLRVHRRCEEPMFTISNRIAYDGMMVHAVERLPDFDRPPSCWIDVRAQVSEGNWIAEEGDRALELLDYLRAGEGAGGEVVCLSPFRHVVAGLRRHLAERYPGVHVGTVHTYQGKEADTVVLVLGGNVNREGGLDWAARRPNLLNVAVSRARRRLYVIGNLGRWRQRPYFSELADELMIAAAPEEGS